MVCNAKADGFAEPLDMPCCLGKQLTLKIDLSQNDYGRTGECDYDFAACCEISRFYLGGYVNPSWGVFNACPPFPAHNTRPGELDVRCYPSRDHGELDVHYPGPTCRPP